jgi:hypothetical protein
MNNNSDEISTLIDNFSTQLQRISSRSKPEQQQIWKQFPSMSEEQIIAACALIGPLDINAWVQAWALT